MSIVVLVSVLLKMASGNLDEAQAQRHAEAIKVAAEDSGLDAALASILPEDSITGVDLLTGMTRPESHFIATVVSRKECTGSGDALVCVRRAGIWKSRKKPVGARPTYYCGVMQVGGKISWDRCLQLIDDIELNYLTGAAHVVTWLNEPVCRKYKGEKRLRCALLGYGGGYPAIERGTLKYPAKVLKWARYARRLRQTAETEAGGNV